MTKIIIIVVSCIIASVVLWMGVKVIIKIANDISNEIKQKTDKDIFDQANGLY